MLTASTGWEDTKPRKAFDASQWSSPIRLRLELAGVSGIGPKRLVLHAHDSSGKHESFVLFEEISDRTVTFGPIKPKGGDKAAYDEVLSAFENIDSFRIVVDAERVVAKHRLQGGGGWDEEHQRDYPAVDTGFIDELELSLPKGAKVEPT